MPYFKDLSQVSRHVGVPQEHLIRCFELEKEFHRKILAEKNSFSRKAMYKQIYQNVHPYYRGNDKPSGKEALSDDPMVKYFQNEIEGKSLLDIGCGDGRFLHSIYRKQLKSKELCGIDIDISAAKQLFSACSKTYSPSVHKKPKKLRLIESDIIDFRLDRKYDVGFSRGVLEHIAPADVEKHIESIRLSIKNKGYLILITPNRYFGPSDITKIIDYSFCNKLPAICTHLHEYAFGELLDVLKNFGFSDFQSIIQFPIFQSSLAKLRISPRVYIEIEKKAVFLRILYSIKRKKQCFFRLRNIIICQNNK